MARIQINNEKWSHIAGKTEAQVRREFEKIRLPGDRITGIKDIKTEEDIQRAIKYIKETYAPSFVYPISDLQDFPKQFTETMKEDNGLLIGNRWIYGKEYIYFNFK